MKPLTILLFSACATAVILAQQSPTGFIISGRIVDPLKLSPEGATLRLARQTDNFDVSIRPVTIQPDGAFATERVPPGRYVLEIVRTPGFRTKDTVGFQVIHVTTADVLNVTVAVRRETSLTGRFRMVSDNPSAKWPPQINVTTLLAFDGNGSWPGGPAEGATGGKFILRNAFGPRVLRCGYTLRGDRWWPDRVLLDGKDITDVPTDFSEHAGANLEVLFTQHPSAFTGKAVLVDGQPAGRAWIAVAAADPRQRQLWATTSRTSQADPDGSFRIVSLPGRYVVQAFPPLVVSSRHNAWRLFSRLGPDAITADLGEREQNAITLTLHER